LNTINPREEISIILPSIH